MDTKILETKSNELKTLVSRCDTKMFLSTLSQQMIMIGKAEGNCSEWSKLSSPMRQIYYLGGLLLTSDLSEPSIFDVSDEELNQMASLLNEIEIEYFKIFIPTDEEGKDEEWKKKCQAAMPSFLSYFNLGPLNYEEQSINQIQKVYMPLDARIEAAIGLKTEDFLNFYESLDNWCQYNFSMFNGLDSKSYPLRDNWQDYTDLQIGILDEVPDEIQEIGKNRIPFLTFIKDYGIKNRFKSDDLVTPQLSYEKVEKIMSLLSCHRMETDFLYYTSTKPANPLYETPIVDLGDGLYQVFEEKQVLHAIDNYLESLLKSNPKAVSKYNKSKGDFLENSIANIFQKYLGTKAEIYQSYYVDGHEQDILILWNKYAFIIEAKNYKHDEPFRDPVRAYKRIKQEFDDCIGYAYKQIRRVEPYFFEGKLLVIKDEHNNVIKTIDTKQYEGNDFYIIVNTNPFGQVQVDLSMLLDLDDNGRFPWAVKYDDLEVFLLTLIQKHKNPQFFIDFLIMREYLHDHIIGSDELEICGGFITGDITELMAEDDTTLITTHPSLANVFDEQYRKGIGFKNEKHLAEKKSGKTLIW